MTMTYKSLLPIWGIMIGCTILFGIGIVSAINQENQRAALGIELTQNVCDNMRKNYSASNKRACGLAQQISNNEYLCNSTNTVCWVETK